MHFDSDGGYTNASYVTCLVSNFKLSYSIQFIVIYGLRRRVRIPLLHLSVYVHNFLLYLGCLRFLSTNKQTRNLPFYVIRNFFTLSTTHCCQTVPLRFVWISSFHLRLSFPSYLILSFFLIKMLCAVTAEVLWSVKATFMTWTTNSTR